MNYERLGIYVTIIIMVGVLGLASVGTGQIDISELGYNPNGAQTKSIPQINSGTDNTSDGFYNYCYKMGLDC